MSTGNFRATKSHAKTRLLSQTRLKCGYKRITAEARRNLRRTRSGDNSRSRSVRYSKMASEADETVEALEDATEVEVIPMRRCKPRSKSLPFGQLLVDDRARERLRRLAASGTHTPPRLPSTPTKNPNLTLKESLQFLESSHNDLVYKTKKVEYILEKEKRALEKKSGRRQSTGQHEHSSIGRLKSWFKSKITQNKNVKTAEETYRQAEETMKSATDLIVKLDDTMTQEEELLQNRANQLRRKSMTTFKLIPGHVKSTARRTQSDGFAMTNDRFQTSDLVDDDANHDIEDEDDVFESSGDESDQDTPEVPPGATARNCTVQIYQQRPKTLPYRRKSSFSLDENYVNSLATEDSVVIH